MSSEQTPETQDTSTNPGTTPGTDPARTDPRELGRATRAKLVEAATRAFAEHGAFNASLLDITRQAGQRNRGAVHYHFGSREKLLAAVLEQHADFLAERELRLLEVARSRPVTDLASAVEPAVRPMVELAGTGWRGRCYPVILGELVAEEILDEEPDLRAAVEHSGGYAVFELIARRMPPMSEALLRERLSLFSGFALRAIGDRSRALDRAERGEAGPHHRPQLDEDGFVANLVGMSVAMLTAPVPDPEPAFLADPTG
ncbi:TetR family transcriptional regulator [Nocardioides bruguierae]|uniref:TetR family transcriptional regulator n=1 Tax=Nocardioides bruguierae TaxID=2945102 RepID=UPI0020200C8F|nr:TetR family transcriptional regulator [Nocardioides bruguierae]MCL8025230.1 TetR family transcriptional regulator [Nocardioides bruguierae]